MKFPILAVVAVQDASLVRMWTLSITLMKENQIFIDLFLSCGSWGEPGWVTSSSHFGVWHLAQGYHGGALPAMLPAHLPSFVLTLCLPGLEPRTQHSSGLCDWKIDAALFKIYWFIFFFLQNLQLKSKFTGKVVFNVNAALLKEPFKETYVSSRDRLMRPAAETL